jgi:hypothetical protein
MRARVIFLLLSGERWPLDVETPLLVRAEHLARLALAPLCPEADRAAVYSIVELAPAPAPDLPTRARRLDGGLEGR